MPQRTIALFLVLVAIALVAGALRLATASEDANALMHSIAPPPSAFSQAEANAFFESAENADLIADPLQRCLAYPDPPGSHWLKRVVAAACHYRFQPVLPLARVKQLVDAGHVAELDQRLADALSAQRLNPETRGLFDQTYVTDFKDHAADMRPVLDAWKRQDPDSAFALAASGVAYVWQAREARGVDAVDDASPDQLDTMSRLLALARSDLEKAERIDPRLTPVYAATIEMDGLQGKVEAGRAAVSRGLGVDPENYWIYSRWAWLSRPVWGGSINAIRSVTARAQTHAKENPLLLLLLPEADALDAGIDCSCRSWKEVAAYRRVFDFVPQANLLGSAGTAASEGKQTVMAAIYLAEATRFDPALVDERVTFVNTLAELQRTSWGLLKANRLVALAPHNTYALNARAFTYRNLGELPLAERDLLASLAIEPDDAWTLDEIGEIYVHRTHDWDKGWDIADRLIKAHPDDYHGWLLRGSIQKDQPRPGLHDTLVEIDARFGNDLAVQSVMPEVRARLANDAAAARNASH